MFFEADFVAIKVLLKKYPPPPPQKNRIKAHSKIQKSPHMT